MIYEPAEDSFLLEKYVKIYSKGNVLDMGCGSGIQSLASKGNVLSVDINEEAVEFCKKKGLNAIQSDLFSNINEKFDLIIFNPPYLPKDNDEDPESALITTGGKTGMEILERFFYEVREYLVPNGKILLVCSSLTGDIEKLFKKNSFNFKLLETKNYFFEELRIYLVFESLLTKGLSDTFKKSSS